MEPNPKVSRFRAMTRSVWHSGLDELGVAFIEGGWPGSNPKDVEFFERARDMEWKNALIAAFGSTCRVKGWT